MKSTHGLAVAIALSFAAMTAQAEITGTLGGPWPMIGGPGLWQPFIARITAGVPQLVDHDDMRWLAADELESVEWLASDQPVMGEVARLLSA